MSAKVDELVAKYATKVSELKKKRKDKMMERMTEELWLPTYLFEIINYINFSLLSSISTMIVLGKEWRQLVWKFRGSKKPVKGVEPLAFCLRGKCSTNWAKQADSFLSPNIFIN